MADFDFASSNYTAEVPQFTYAAGVAEVLTITAVSNLPASRLQSKTKFGISYRARSTLPRLQSKTVFGLSIKATGRLQRIQSKTVFGASVKAVGQLPRLKSKALITKKEFVDKTFNITYALADVTSPLFTFTKPAILGLAAVSVLPRIKSKVFLGPPQNLNAISELPRLRGKSSVYVPNAIVAHPSLPRIQSFTRILIPPINIVGQSPLSRLQSKALVQVPYVMVAKARFRLFSSGTMNVSVNAIGDGYFGALRSDGLVEVDGEIARRRRRTSTSVN